MRVLSNLSSCTIMKALLANELPDLGKPSRPVACLGLRRARAPYVCGTGDTKDRRRRSARLREPEATFRATRRRRSRPGVVSTAPREPSLRFPFHLDVFHFTPSAGGYRFGCQLD